jgi:probable phosphoglycerate mutase
MADSATTFHLIRHGAHDLLGRVLVGRAAGVSLNAQGQAQAASVADTLAGATLGAIVCSPLQRAREMAAPLAARLGRAPRIEEALADLDFGDWTNLPFDELHRLPAWQAFNGFRGGTGIPGGESMIGVQARAVELLLRLRQEFPRGEVAIFSHGDVIKTMLMNFLGTPLDLIRRIEIAPGSRSVIEMHDGDAKILAVNLPALV